MLKIFIIIFITSVCLNAGWVSEEQFERMLSFNKTVDKVVKEYPNTKIFKKYMLGMYLKESSLGNYVISDRYPNKYLIRHNGKKVEIEKDFYMKTRKKYTTIDAYYVFYKGYQKKVYVVKGDIVKTSEASLGALMARVPTAKYVIKKLELKQYYKYLNDDLYLVNTLINNTRLNITISMLYLRLNYDRAVAMKMNRPIARAIGKHNGGWGNFTYYNKVMRDVKYTNDALVEDRWNILNN